MTEGGQDGAKGLRALGTREAWRLRRAGTAAWVERKRPSGQDGGRPKRRQRAQPKVSEQKREWRLNLKAGIARARVKEKRAREEEAAKAEERAKRVESTRGEWERNGSEQRPGRRRRAVRNGRGSGRGSGRARRRLVRRTRRVVADERRRGSGKRSPSGNMGGS